MPACLFLIFSDRITPAQEEDAFGSLGVQCIGILPPLERNLVLHALCRR